ncbi:hypothetical protein ABZX40_03355 [Streptomyces sp. NPDC004610]|uniref:hypothetical protein n=1 Tax=unclassified Streptomyces TaxID=2593676 RepID=UPI0033B25015
MDDDSGHPGGARSRTPSGGTDPGAGGRAGVLGTALAGVLAFALSSGSWQWFSTYIGLTLLAVILAFTRPPVPTPGGGGAYIRGLTVYALVVGLCVALAVAPAMQRWAWFFPMPGTRADCAQLGDHAALQTRADLGDLADRAGTALSYAQSDQRQHAVNDCLAATTTQWLPVYGLAAAVVAALAVWAVAGRGGAKARAR